MRNIGRILKYTIFQPYSTENRKQKHGNSVKLMTCRNGVTKNKLRQHNVTMIGDSFLRGIRENVELSLNNKFGIHSMVKPGCDLNTLLESA